MQHNQNTENSNTEGVRKAPFDNLGNASSKSYFNLDFFTKESSSRISN